MEKINCIFCEIAGHKFEAGNRHLNLVPPISVSECPKCRLLFLSPRPSENDMQQFFEGNIPESLLAYSKSTPDYSAVTGTRRELFAKRIRHLKKLIGPTEKTPKILDVGASSGVFLEEAVKLGFDSFGIEPGKNGYESCKRRGLKVELGQAEALPFGDSFFDVVHSNHVFEHLQNPLLAIKEINRVLKPGGFVFIEVPNQLTNIQFFRDCLLNRIHVRKRNIRSIHHFYFFSKKSFKRLFREGNLVDIKITTRYGKTRTGVGAFGSYMMRFIGFFFFGGPFLIGVGKKPGDV